METADRWIHALGMRPHPEGGCFVESYRSLEALPAGTLPERFLGPRACSSAILYLLRQNERSRYHRLRADEVWHLYAGGPLHLHLLHPDGRHERLVLGLDLASGERPQWVVPHGTWFAAEPAADVAYVLAGCTVAPGFEFADFELARREELLERFPSERASIERFTQAERG